MAAPTKEEYFTPFRVIRITGTNIDAGTFDYPIERASCNFLQGFSIVVESLTAVDVTVLAGNTAGQEKPVTSDIFGVATLSDDKAYICDVQMPVKTLVLRITRTNATNALDLTFFAPGR